MMRRLPVLGVAAALAVGGAWMGYFPSAPFAVLVFGWAGGARFSRKFLFAAFLWGAVASVALYPAALGWGPVDPYAWGWGNPAFVGVVCAVIGALIVMDQPFGLALLLGLAGWGLGGQGPDNLWDWLIDPLYGLACLLGRPFAFSGRRAAAPALSFPPK